MLTRENEKKTRRGKMTSTRRDGRNIGGTKEEEKDKEEKKFKKIGKKDEEKYITQRR